MRGRRPGAGEAAFWLCVLAIGAVALWRGLGTTAGLDWPYDEDLFRDAAQARTMADGAWLADPFYLGESLWYNPLGPALVAVASKVSDVPTHEVLVRLGPWLGLAAPLAFAGLAAGLVGWPRALVAVLAFVFVTPGKLPALLSATYSPWPFPAQLAQGPLYAGLAVLAVAARRPALPRFVAVGGLLGLTFLAHTAPALLLGAVAASFVALDSSATGRQRLVRLVALLSTALLVASPFLWSIVLRYHARIVNPAPGSWTWPGTGIADLGRILQGSLDRPVLLGLAALGLLALGGRGASRLAPAHRRVVVLWLAWTLVLLAWALAQPALVRAGLPAPSIVPAHHFWMYVGALGSLFIGCGAGWAADRAAVLTAGPGRQAVAGAGITVAIGLGLALSAYPSWREREDFVGTRRVAEYQGGRADRVAANLWVRRHATAGDVFLAEPDLGLRVVATAGRKLVATDRHFSNPFVPWEPRAAAAARMRELLRPGGHEAFHPLAAAYRVSHVIVERASPDQAWPDAAFLTLVFRQGDVSIYRTGCWPE